jgi:hypothetical protein
MSAEGEIDGQLGNLGTEEDHTRVLESIRKRGRAIFVVTVVGTMAAAPA